MRAPLRQAHRARGNSPDGRTRRGGITDGSPRIGSAGGASRRAPVRPRLVTPAFIGLGLAALAYFFADAVLIPTLPVYVSGPLGCRRRLGGDRGGRVQRVRSPACDRGRDDSRIVAVESCPWSTGAAVLRPSRSRVMASPLPYRPSSSCGCSPGWARRCSSLGLSTAMSDLAPPERRGEAMSLFSLSLYVGIAVGSLAGESIVRIGGFSAAWVLAAGAAMLEPSCSPPEWAKPVTPEVVDLPPPSGRLIQRQGAAARGSPPGRGLGNGGVPRLRPAVRPRPRPTRAPAGCSSCSRPS